MVPWAPNRRQQIAADQQRAARQADDTPRERQRSGPDVVLEDAEEGEHRRHEREVVDLHPQRLARGRRGPLQAQRRRPARCSAPL